MVIKALFGGNFKHLNRSVGLIIIYLFVIFATQFELCEAVSENCTIFGN